MDPASFFNAPFDGDLFADFVFPGLFPGDFQLAPVAEQVFPAQVAPMAHLKFLAETTDSSATSPSSSSSAAASPPPQVPGLSPAGSPRHVEVKNEMDMAALPVGVESAPAASHKRKMTSSRAEADTKAATPVQQLSKRQRANARTMKREAHNKAERDRRDELKEGFSSLRTTLPIGLDPERKNQVELLHAAASYIRDLETDSARLKQQMLELRNQLATTTGSTVPLVQSAL